MELDQLLGKLTDRNKHHPPGQDSKKYAILIPIVEIDQRLHLLFEVRSLDLRSQPGEICFPGGRIDPCDENPKAAAIRETIEELGIGAGDITDVYPLIDFYQPGSGRRIYPFAGVIKSLRDLNPNPAEVKEVFTVPLSFLLTTKPEVYTLEVGIFPEDGFPFHLIPNGKNYKWKKQTIKEYFYFYQDYCIWGLTAFILRQFLALIKDD